jgi:hypothetical protein
MRVVFGVLMKTFSAEAGLVGRTDKHRVRRGRRAFFID